MASEPKPFRSRMTNKEKWGQYALNHCYSESKLSLSQGRESWARYFKWGIRNGYKRERGIQIEKKKKTTDAKKLSKLRNRVRLPSPGEEVPRSGHRKGSDYQTRKHLKNSLNARCLLPFPPTPPKVSNATGLEWGLRICIAEHFQEMLMLLAWAPCWLCFRGNQSRERACPPAVGRRVARRRWQLSYALMNLQRSWLRRREFWMAWGHEQG